MSSIIYSILVFAIWFLWFMNRLVSLDVRIPKVDETSFSLFSVINAIIRMNERSLESKTGKDIDF
jgi:hypothetical protein